MFPEPDPNREGHCGYDCALCKGTPEECTGHQCNWCSIGEGCPVYGDPGHEFCKYQPFTYITDQVDAPVEATNMKDYRHKGALEGGGNSRCGPEP